VSLRALFANHGLESQAAPARISESGTRAVHRASELQPMPSETLPPATMRALCARLLVIAEAEGMGRRLVEDLSPEDVAGCEGLSDAELLAYLSAVQQSAHMARGFVPAGWNRAGFCSHCGPVYLPTDHPKQSNRCPWCRFTRKGSGFIRPPVRCGDCLHFRPGAYQPAAGMGSCAIGKVSRFAALPYPHATRHCRFWLHQSQPEASRGPP